MPKVIARCERVRVNTKLPLNANAISIICLSTDHVSCYLFPALDGGGVISSCVGREERFECLVDPDNLAWAWNVAPFHYWAWGLFFGKFPIQSTHITHETNCWSFKGFLQDFIIVNSYYSTEWMYRFKKLSLPSLYHLNFDYNHLFDNNIV